MGLEAVELYIEYQLAYGCDSIMFQVAMKQEQAVTTNMNMDRDM